MHELIHHETAPQPHHHREYRRLQEEIVCIEARLHAIGHNGDCAYEKALARRYSELLQDHRRQLFRLGFRAVPPS